MVVGVVGMGVVVVRVVSPQKSQTKAADFWVLSGGPSLISHHTSSGPSLQGQFVSLM